MSASRPVSTTRTLIGVAIGAAALGAAAGGGCGYTVGMRTADPVRELMVLESPGRDRIAFVREAPCGEGRCQTLWLGTTREDATEVASLGAAAAGCAAEPRRARRHPLVSYRAGHHVLAERRRRHLRRLPQVHVRVQIGPGGDSLAAPRKGTSTQGAASCRRQPAHTRRACPAPSARH